MNANSSYGNGASAIFELPRPAAFSHSAADHSGARFLPNNLTAQLVGLGSQEVLRCSVKEFDEDGLRIDVPMGSGLSVGQRYEIVFAGTPEADNLARRVGDSHYATILQTEVMHSPAGRQLGVSMRFDQPLML